MSVKNLQFISIVVTLLVCSHANSELYFSRNARTFELSNTTLVTKALAQACLGITDMPDGLACQPAWTPLLESPGVGLHLQLSNGSAAVESVKKLLSGKVDQELTDLLFSKGRIIQIDTGLEIYFKGKYLNIALIPGNIKAMSVVRNEANPDVDLISIEEKGVTAQTGLRVYKSLYGGLQVRSFQRKFIKKKFKLLALASDGGSTLLKPQEQSVLYFEPGLSYILDLPWKTRLSLLWVNYGQVSSKSEDLSDEAHVQAGISIDPPFPLGLLTFNVDYKRVNYDNPDHTLHVGAIYRFGVLHSMIGIDPYGLSAGLYYRLNNMSSGLVFSSTQQINTKEEYYTQTVYLDVGWHL